MKRALILMLSIAALALIAGCGLRTAGVAQILAPDASVTAPCPRPETFLSTDDWLIMAGRLGDALIECGGEKQILADYVVALQRANSGNAK